MINTTTTKIGRFGITLCHLLILINNLWYIFNVYTLNSLNIFFYLAQQSWFYSSSVEKLDGVDPIDNRPSTNLLHCYVQKE